MSQNEQNFVAVNEDELEKVSGGYLEVSKWRSFTDVEIVRPLYQLSARANGSDKACVEQVIGIIQGTKLPGAEVAGPIENLWRNFSSYRNAIQDESVKFELGNLVGKAYNYICNNR